MESARLRTRAGDGACVVFAAGEYYDDPIDVPRDAFVIAADGGYDHALEAGARVDMLVGDFDSIGAAPGDGGPETLVLPAQKDDPDLLSALKIGWTRGARVFHIYGGLGGRVDHTMSNIQMTALLATRGGVGFLHGDGQIVTAVCDGALVFPAHDVPNGRMVSVFSHSDVSTGVSEPGLRYRLDHARMTNTEVNGLSNEFVDGAPASIEVEHGTLVVVFPAEAPLPRVTHRRVFEGDLGPVSTEVSAALVRG